MRFSILYSIATSVLLAEAALYTREFAPEHEHDNVLVSRDLNLLNGASAGLHSAQQRVEEVKDSFVKSGRPVSTTLVKLLTGLDGQIDNVLGITASTLGKLTFGLTNPVFNAVLGPTFQSLTDGAEVAIGNIVGAPFDAVLKPVTKMLSGSYRQLKHTAKQFNMPEYEEKFDAISKKFDEIEAQQDVDKHNPEVLAARDISLLNGMNSGLSHVKAKTDDVVKCCKTDKSGGIYLGPILLNLIGQIDTASGMVENASHLHGRISDDMLKSIIEPSIKSIAEALELVSTNVEAVTGPTVAIVHQLGNSAVALTNVLHKTPCSSYCDRINHASQTLLKTAGQQAVHHSH